MSKFVFREALALVTGAGSGIGRATAVRLAGLGCRVVVIDLKEDGLVSLRDELGDRYAHHAMVDVSDREAMRKLAEDVYARFGALDILINNAGVGLSGGILETSLDDWEWVFRVNVMGVVHGCYFFLPEMVKKGGGALVNVSSVLGFFPAAKVVGYVASKHAVLGLTESIRAELGPGGLRVSAVCPGVIDTGIISTMRFSGKAEPETARERTQATFTKRGYPAARVADAIIDAINGDVAVLPVSPEAWAMRYVTRFIPFAVPVLSRLSSRGAQGK